MKGKVKTSTSEIPISPGKKKQLLILLQKWKDQGVLYERAAHMLSHEGQIALLELAFKRDVITLPQLAEAVTGLHEQKSGGFEPINKASDFADINKLTPREMDEIYHKQAPECYPGIKRTRCCVYATGCALFLRIRTTDNEPDPDLSKIAMNRFDMILKSSGAHHFYEFLLVNIPRDKLKEKKRELDGIAKALLEKKEAAQGLTDASTQAFEESLQNPDWKNVSY